MSMPSGYCRLRLASRARVYGRLYQKRNMHYPQIANNVMLPILMFASHLHLLTLTVVTFPTATSPCCHLIRTDSMATRTESDASSDRRRIWCVAAGSWEE